MPHNSAVLPDELIAEPGRHTLWLEDLFGRSNSLEFMVTEAAPGAVQLSLPTEVLPAAEPDPTRDPGPPVLRQLLPAGSRPEQGFNLQGDGQSALAVEAENALPGFHRLR